MEKKNVQDKKHLLEWILKEETEEGVVGCDWVWY